MIVDNAAMDTLMNNFASGDIQAFESLYTNLRQPLFRYLIAQTGNKDLSEEVYQEIWGKLIDRKRQWKTRKGVVPYLFGMARNHLIDDARKRKVRLVDSLDRQGEPEHTDQSTPLTHIEDGDQRRVFRLCFSRLPRDQKDAFLLKEEASFSLQLIAEVCGVNRETIKSRLRYALNSLKTCLREQLADGLV